MKISMILTKNLTEHKKVIKTNTNTAITMNIKTTIMEIETLIDADKTTNGKNVRNKMTGNGIEMNVDIKKTTAVLVKRNTLAITTIIVHAIITTIALVIVLAITIVHVKTAITTAV